MYYEEKVIDGVLHHRGTPDGEWIAYDALALTAMLQRERNVRSADEARREERLRVKLDEVTGLLREVLAD